MQLHTVSQAAVYLQLSPRRVLQLINSGQLEAQKLGQQWLITTEELGAFARIPRKVGRPRKELDA